LPCLLNLVPRVIENPDQIVPVVVGGLGYPGDEAARLATGAVALNLIAMALEDEVMALLNGGDALHSAGVRVRRTADEAGGVVLR